MNIESARTFKAYGGFDICSQDDIKLLERSMRFDITGVIINNYGSNDAYLPKQMAIIDSTPLPNSIKGSQIRAVIVETSFDYFDEKCSFGFEYFYKLKINKVLCKGQFKAFNINRKDSFLGYITTKEDIP
jgi:hypothetical protein